MLLYQDRFITLVFNGVTLKIYRVIKELVLFVNKVSAFLPRMCWVLVLSIKAKETEFMESKNKDKIKIIVKKQDNIIVSMARCGVFVSD